jgi:hypothetical protein
MPLPADRVAVRAWQVLVAALLLCVLTAIVMPARARADGDPASDVLPFQPYFLPPDAGASVAQQERLVAVVRAAGHAGVPVRVAVIASPADLGSITALWRQPHNYALFLGQELSLVATKRSLLVVVMPNGLGLYGPGRATAAQRTVLASSPLGGSSGLAGRAIGAIERLAAAAGHPLPRGLSSSPGPPEASRGSTSTASVVAFVVGLALIAAAWAASLRARPLRRA